MSRHCEEVKIGPDGMVSTMILSDTEEADLLAKAFRKFPELRKFGNEIRIRRVYPFYMPDGMFDPSVHVLNADPDQLDFLVKKNTHYDFDRVK